MCYAAMLVAAFKFKRVNPVKYFSRKLACQQEAEVLERYEGGAT